MRQTVSALAISLLILASPARADALIESPTGRSAPFGSTPAVLRGILISPDQPSDTALLYFRGAPGYARIESLADRNRNVGSVLRPNLALLAREGITLVLVDCPSDEWGGPADTIPSRCLDNYRSSQAHAADVRALMARLRREHGLSKFYLMGHSAGTLSSRWLALHLGGEIEGSIHSASLNVANPWGFGRSLRGFPYARVAAPMLHIHHQDDACRFSPYAEVKAYAGEQLLTVRGGRNDGEPCGATHFHSFHGREAAVGRAIVGWIKTRRTPREVGL
jgi:hypothetical protein